MRTLIAFSLVVIAGCFSEPHLPYQPVPVAYDNPVTIPIANYELVWDGVRDIVVQNFRIEREVPVQLNGGTLTEGWIDTFPMPGATYLEPWYHDSANDYERLESTLQSIRRRAVVHIIPIPAQSGGFWVDVAVFKELENLRRPEHATAGSATFRGDASLSSRFKPDQPAADSRFWIPQGRDTAAEQRMIGQILDRFTPAGAPVPIN